MERDQFRVIQEWIKKVDERSVERDNRLAAQLRSVLQQQQLSGQVAIVEQQKQILAHVYQQASSYANLVILAGYAGLFAVWQLTKANLSSFSSLCIALLTTISLIIFAGFEVLKMIRQGMFARKLNRIINSNFEPHEHIEAWRVAWTAEATRESQLWVWFLVPTLITGFGAACWLLVTFFLGLGKFI